MYAFSAQSKARTPADYWKVSFSFCSEREGERERERERERELIIVP